jgi:hypothetical protein
MRGSMAFAAEALSQSGSSTSICRASRLDCEIAIIWLGDFAPQLELSEAANNDCGKSRVPPNSALAARQECEAVLLSYPQPCDRLY